MNKQTNRKILHSLLLIAGVGSVAAQSVPKKPNLLIIMADQWRGNALGFMNVEPVKTPNLDRLASQGTAFTQAASGFPVSSPARAMLMTGRYPFATGVPTNCHSLSEPYGVEMHADAVCWSDVLNSKGYKTAYIGKWHLDAPRAPYVNTANNKGEMAWNEWCPPERRHGFQEWVAYGTYDRHLNPMYWSRDAARDDFYYAEQWGPEHEVDKAIGFLNGIVEADSFAMMISMNPPHTGYDLVPEKYKQLYHDLNVDSLSATVKSLIDDPGKAFFKQNVADYYACMTGVDDQIGRLMTYLKERGLDENTVVVFTSDHGDQMGMNGLIGKDVPFDASMHIPMIIRYPNRVAAGVNSDLLISLEDLYPTLLSMMGFARDIDPNQVQTRDLSRQVLGKGGAKPQGQLYFAYDIYKPGYLRAGWRGFRTDRYTLANRYDDGKVVEQRLYDRQQDPFMLTDIATTQPDVVRKIDRRLAAELQKIGDPVMMQK